MFNTPVLFLIFNRPQHTARSFAAIRATQPARLYVAADGPREGHATDEDQCKLAREVVTSGIDWPCRVQYLLRNHNLGCGKAVSEAITWFFSREEEGVILEDDCLPSSAFFAFSETMLAWYRSDDSVMHINGTYMLGAVVHPSPSPYLSLYAGIWGWATWRRAWEHYRLQLDEFTTQRALSFLQQQNAHPQAVSYWRKMFDRMLRGEIDTWDYQWHACIWSSQAKAISPGRNLVSNIGFGPGATHTTENQSPYANITSWEGPAKTLLNSKLFARPNLDRAAEQWSLQIPPPSPLLLQWLQKGKSRAGKLVQRIKTAFISSQS